MDPSSYFSFQPVIHDWCSKGRGMCHPVCGMMHIKEPLLLIGKSSPCCGSGFPLSLSEWSFTICLTPYTRKYNVLSASLNKTVPSFLHVTVRDGYPQILRTCAGGLKRSNLQKYLRGIFIINNKLATTIVNHDRCVRSQYTIYPVLLWFMYPILPFLTVWKRFPFSVV